MDKRLYKIELLCLKAIPYILCAFYVLDLIIVLPIFNVLAHVSIIPLCFIWLSSYVFKFCWKHRLPIYYIMLTKLYNLCNYLFVIPIWLYKIVMILFIIIGIALLGYGLFKFIKN